MVNGLKNNKELEFLNREKELIYRDQELVPKIEILLYKGNTPYGLISYLVAVTIRNEDRLSFDLIQWISPKIFVFLIIKV
jgi:hypothetical protein